jgi:ribosome maturation factor RimP
MNSTNNNSFEIAAKKVFSDLYALIKEDEKETENKIDNNKKDNKNVKSNKKDNKIVISNKIDNKIVKSNKIDDKNVISNEIKELMDEEQIINGKTIEFGTFINTDIVVPLNTKEDIKEYIFHYINLDFQDIKKYAKKRKVRLSNDDMCKCFFILFKRCKILFDLNKVYYNMDDNEEKDFFMEYLKLKNLSLP